MTINSNNNNKDTDILNRKSISGSISQDTASIAEQNPDNSNIDFNVVRDITPRVLSTSQAGKKKVYIRKLLQYNSNTCPIKLV